jgi:hypothetical protein
MVGGHFIHKGNGVGEFTYIVDIRYSRFYFTYKYVSILIGNHGTTITLKNSKII